MGQKQTGKFCPMCKKHTMAIGNKPNHILHLLLSIITGGWIIVWILVTVAAVGSYRCTQCGSKV